MSARSNRSTSCFRNRAYNAASSPIRPQPMIAMGEGRGAGWERAWPVDDKEDAEAGTELHRPYRPRRKRTQASETTPSAGILQQRLSAPQNLPLRRHLSGKPHRVLKLVQKLILRRPLRSAPAGRTAKTRHEGGQIGRVGLSVVAHENESTSRHVGVVKDTNQVPRAGPQQKD